MMESEILRFIRREIQRQINIILAGEAGSNDVTTETIQNLFPGMPGIEGRPVMHPYGIASRAPKGTISVIGRHGDHPGNRVVLGHRAADRPTSLDEGESVLYSKDGYRVVMKNDRIMVGKGDDLEEVVVGQTLKELLVALIEAIVMHRHIGNLGYDTSPPSNSLDFEQMKADYLENDKILSKDGGRY